jgi:hypothetical protein
MINQYIHKLNRVGLLGATPLHKVVGLFCMLLYGVPTDSADEIGKVGEITKQFVKVVVVVFGDQ